MTPSLRHLAWLAGWRLAGLFVVVGIVLSPLCVMAATRENIPQPVVATSCSVRKSCHARATTEGDSGGPVGTREEPTKPKERREIEDLDEKASDVA